MAISGNTALVGANGEDGGPGDPVLDAGAAYVFARDEGGADTWGEVKKLTASDAHPNARFGCSVAISDDTAIVGAWGQNTHAGAAYVFARDEGGMDDWGEVKKLTASDAQAFDFFSIVAVSGATAIVGAWRGVLLPTGAAYVFG